MRLRLCVTLVLFAWSMALLGAPTWIEHILPGQIPQCGAYKTENQTSEFGCRDQGDRSACDDGTPGFMNKNYKLSREHLRKYYEYGARHLCTPWTETGDCCNTIAEGNCPPSNCYL